MAQAILATVQAYILNHFLLPTIGLLMIAVWRGGGGAVGGGRLRLRSPL